MSSWTNMWLIQQQVLFSAETITPESLDDDSVVTLVHTIVVSRVDCRLGEVYLLTLRQAAMCPQRSRSSRVKYDRGLTRHFRWHVLHWLDVADRIRSTPFVREFEYQHSMALGYLAELCQPVSSIDGHRRLWFAPLVRLSTYGGRVFCHAGPSAWNALLCPKNNALSLSNFMHQLKHFLLLVLLAHRAHASFFTVNALHKFPTYLLWPNLRTMVSRSACTQVVLHVK